MASTLATLRDLIVDHLKVQPWASANGITVIARKKGVTGAKLREMVQGLHAPGIIVFLPTPRGCNANLTVGSPVDLSVEMQVVEYASVNKSALEADDVAILCLRALWGWTPVSPDWPIAPEPIPLIPGEAESPFIINILMTTTGTLEIS